GAALLTVFVLMSRCVWAQDPGAEALERKFRSTVTPFLKAHCLNCHGQNRQEAKLDLSGYTTAGKVASSHQIWETVLERIASKEMPPKEAKRQPAAQDRKAVVAWIHAAREHEARRNAGDPGLVLARRLSNAEYNASVRDLTGSDIRPTRTFPVDPANAAGFDNSGESLAMSPALLRKYLQASREVVEHLVLKPDGIAFASHPVVTDTDRDRYCVKRIVEFYQRQPTDLADYFFAAWQYRFRAQLDLGSESLEQTAARTGVSGKYLKSVWSLLASQDPQISVGPILRLQKMWPGPPSKTVQPAAARRECERMRDYVVALRGKLRPRLQDLKLEGSHVGSQPFVLWRNRQYVANRRTYDREILQVRKVEQVPAPAISSVDAALRVPADAEQRKRHEAAFARFCDIFPDAFYVSERGRDYVEESKKQMGEKGRLLSAGFHSMMGYFRDDRPLYEMMLSTAEQQELDGLWRELDFVTRAPMRQYSGFLWFERTDSRYMREAEFDFARPENQAALSQRMIRQLNTVYVKKARRTGGGDVEISAIEHYFREINDQIRWVEKARLEAEPGHIQAVLQFADRAWRRALSVTQRKDLVNYYQGLREQDQLSHEEAIQDLVVAILMSPHFCFRMDMAGSGSERQPLSNGELASRLSYFLWSSIPDRELRRLAASGRLRQPDVLRAQTRRMLQDDRVRGLATEFTGNWLDFRRFEQHNSVDRERFPVFTDQLRQAMFEEPIHFVVDVIQQDRSVFTFLDAKHTFVNATLASHYGIPDQRLETLPAAVSAGTSRTFSGLVRGAGNTVPRSDEDAANGLAGGFQGQVATFATVQCRPGRGYESGHVRFAMGTVGPAQPDRQTRPVRLRQGPEPRHGRRTASSPGKDMGRTGLSAIRWCMALGLVAGHGGTAHDAAVLIIPGPAPVQGGPVVPDHQVARLPDGPMLQLRRLRPLPQRRQQGIAVRRRHVVDAGQMGTEIQRLAARAPGAPGPGAPEALRPARPRERTYPPHSWSWLWNGPDCAGRSGPPNGFAWLHQDGPRRHADRRILSRRPVAALPWRRCRRRAPRWRCRIVHPA
ncbi:MAG: DUF1592 domain-containing protein, partial [Planctomycetaceae bacterium]